jgi:hypothetical protein
MARSRFSPIQSLKAEETLVGIPIVILNEVKDPPQADESR